MIVAVCADKGSPGATTLAVALSMALAPNHPTTVLLEADPGGGDLAFWAREPTTDGLLAPDPSLLSLAVDARTAPTPQTLARHTQTTAWGIPVVTAPPRAAGFEPVRRWWPAIAQAAAAHPGPVVVDLGRLGPEHPGLALARSATVVLVVSHFSVESLFHTRELAADLVTGSEPAHPGRPRVAVAVRAGRRQQKEAAAQTEAMLASTGLPVPVAGVVLDDEPAAAELRSGRPGRKTATGPLLSSATALVAALTDPTTGSSSAPSTGATRDQAVPSSGPLTGSLSGVTA